MQVFFITFNGTEEEEKKNTIFSFDNHMHKILALDPSQYLEQLRTEV